MLQTVSVPFTRRLMSAGLILLFTSAQCLCKGSAVVTESDMSCNFQDCVPLDRWLKAGQICFFQVSLQSLVGLFHIHSFHLQRVNKMDEFNLKPSTLFISKPVVNTATSWMRRSETWSFVLHAPTAPRHCLTPASNLECSWCSCVTTAHLLIVGLMSARIQVQGRGCSCCCCCCCVRTLCLPHIIGLELRVEWMWRVSSAGHIQTPYQQFTRHLVPGLFIKVLLSWHMHVLMLHPWPNLYFLMLEFVSMPAAFKWNMMSGFMIVSLVTKSEHPAFQKLTSEFY